MQSASSELERELAPGEQLLWSSKPLTGVRLTGKDAFLIPFGLAWLAFSLAFETMALRVKQSAGGFGLLFPLFGLPFVLIGFFLVGGRFWFEARARNATAYGITNRRILTITRFWNLRVRSLDLTQITDVESIERPDGSGSLRFIAAGLPAYIMAGSRQQFPIAGGDRFDFLPNVREAAIALEKARRAAKA